MPEVTDLHIATDLEDLKRIAYPEKLGKNPKALENVIKNLYHEIVRETKDQEKCYIHCLRYLLSIDTLCRISDAKYVTLFYAREIARVTDTRDELRPILLDRYKQAKLKENKENEKSSNNITAFPKLEAIHQKLFPNEFISVKELFNAIQDNADILIVDIRPAEEYIQSKIKFENIINIPEDIIVAGLSANVISNRLKDGTQKIWEKRDSFQALVFLDWNSGADNITCTKLNFLKDSVVEWDCLRKYKQHPAILDGGFKEFLDSYPGSVTNVHVNLIRNNEDIDELLELDSISYPEPDQNVSIMPLKQFTIEDLEESANSDQQMNDEIENGDTNVMGEPPSLSKDDIIVAKGGASDTFIQPKEIIEDEPLDEIKNVMEEERTRILNEARNKKNKSKHGIESVPEQIGDKHSIEEVKKTVPPLVRRETKPKRVDYTSGGWCGLVNLKNTCYMNTVLQCLKCIPIIRSVVHSYYEKYITKSSPQIMHNFASTIKTLCEGTEFDKTVFRPSSFYDVVCKLDSIYKKGNHEDCMEFFLFLFNHLSDDCSYDIKKRNVMIEREKSWYSNLQGRTSVWVDLFYHQFKNIKICPSCHSTAASYETDNTLMLSVPYKAGLRAVHLGDLIAEYMDDNQIMDYKCSKCQHLGVISRKEIVVAPEILVLVLKRYYQDEYQETRKNNVCVHFEKNFTFSSYSYKLCSIAEHRGTMDHGHYFAHGFLDDSVLVEFNDETVTRATSNWESIRGSACAFFYYKESKK